MAKKVCRSELNIASLAGVTGNQQSDAVRLPAGVGRWLLKISSTQNSAGGYTLKLQSSDDNSFTDSLDNLSQAVVAAGVLYVDDASATEELLLGRARVDISSVTGDWDIDVSLIYAEED